MDVHQRVENFAVRICIHDQKPKAAHACCITHHKPDLITRSRPAATRAARARDRDARDARSVLLAQLGPRN